MELTPRAPTLRFTASLRQSIRVPALEPARMRFAPLRTASDFANMSAIESDCEAAVYMSHPTYYGLIARLVENVSSALQGKGSIFVRYSAPCLTRIPERLLTSEVFLCADPDALVPLVPTTDWLVVIKDRFRKDATELGDNSLEIDGYGDSACKHLEAAIRQWPIYTALSKPTFHEVMHHE